MEKEKEDKIESLVESYFLEFNDSKNRKNFADDVGKILEFDFADTTTDEMVSDGFVRCEGLNPKTNKVTILTITPSSCF